MAVFAGLARGRAAVSPPHAGRAFVGRSDNMSQPAQTQRARKKAAAPSRGKTPPTERACSQSGYLSAEIAVSTESLAMNAAPHQFEPGPPGLIGVEATLDAVWSLVK